MERNRITFAFFCVGVYFLFFIVSSIAYLSGNRYINDSSRELILTLGIAGFLVGPWIFMKGFHWYSEKLLIENTPTSKVRSISRGRVELFGEVVLVNENVFLKSPHSRANCVLYKYISGENEEFNSTLFYLKDKTGKVLVDPSGAEIDIHCLGHSEFIREYCLLPGDRVYVHGTAGGSPLAEGGEAQKSEESLMIKKGKKDSFFYISDKPERELRYLYETKAWGGLMAGWLMIVLSLTIVFNYFNLL